MHSSKARDCQALRMRKEALVSLVDIDSNDRSDGGSQRLSILQAHA